jgi:hypothetical protein
MNTVNNTLRRLKNHGWFSLPKTSGPKRMGTGPLNLEVLSPFF